MNIKIANRLVKLRKEHNLSQEALAEKLGISRQAVSKWERAEASPDTDNLIMLAKLYGISLDALLLLEEEKSDFDVTEENTSQNKDENVQHENNAEKNVESEEEPEEYVHVGLKGVHVKDKDSEVHVGWNGIYVNDKRKNENVHIGNGKVNVNGEEYGMKDFKHLHELHKEDNRSRSLLYQFPMAVVVIAAYILMGVFLDAWHPGWLIFLAIPLWYTAIEAIINKNAYAFAYPVLVVLGFFCMGFFMNAWHPGWVLFLTIPIYYCVLNYIIKTVKSKKKQD